MSLISREDAIKELMSWLPKLENGLIHWTGVKAMLENLPTVNPDGWISVEDRLPKKGQVVLWCNDDGNSFTSAITYECEEYWAIGNRHRGSRVIAWRPLPPAFRPKEDK